MTEVWRDIPCFSGYQASDAGRVRSLDRVVPCKNGVRLHRGRVLTPFYAKSTGYLQLHILGGRQSVHRLVALAWCDGHFDGAWVDHKNGRRDDNHPQNLEWVTASENARRAFQNGREAHWRGKFSGDHSTSKTVESRNLVTGEIRRWPSGMDAVRSGFDSGSITRCCQGKQRRHKGHAWRYGDRHGVRWSDEARA